MRNYKPVLTFLALFAIVATLMSVIGAVAHASTVSHPTFTGKEQYAHTANPKEYYNIYTENGGHYSESLKLTEAGNVYSPVFQVIKASGQWIYPNIGQGAERGMKPYNTWLPVPANHDGNPGTSVTTHLVWRGDWNAGYDIWLEPRYDPYGTQEGKGGTEVMIWTAASRNGHAITRGPGYAYPSVFIDGIWWNVNASTGNWHRIYFVAQHPRNSFKGALNPFFAGAIHDHALAGSWELTGLDYGFEIDTPGNSGLAVTSYWLSGVRYANAQHESVNNTRHP